MHPQLQFVADRRLGVFTAEEARRAGYSPDEIRAAVRSRRWHAPRRGVYIEGDQFEAAASDPRLRHLIACAAVLVTLRRGPVVSHGSAARLHRLVVPRGLTDEVRLTDEEQWRSGRHYRVARAALPAGHVRRIAPFTATTPARTLIDCAREWPVTDSVVAIDAAIHAGLATRADLVAALRAGRHWVGIGSAARALALADERAESPLESRGRLALLAAGFPRPELQSEIHERAGSSRASTLATTTRRSASSSTVRSSTSNRTAGAHPDRCSGTRSAGRTGCAGSVPGSCAWSTATSSPG